MIKFNNFYNSLKESLYETKIPSGHDLVYKENINGHEMIITTNKNLYYATIDGENLDVYTDEKEAKLAAKRFIKMVEK